jgi:spore coat protein U-like protein
MPPASIRRAVVAAALLAAPLAVSPARACTISATGVPFGAYNPQTAGADDGTGTVNLACPTAVTAPVVALSTGQSGTYAARRMTSGAYNLTYNLYTSSARTTIWGNGTGGSVTQTLSGGTLSGGTRNFSRSIFGRIPALQNVGAGSYSDTIILTVTF